jgi:methyl coenzyme M reductase gamma subunit
MKTITLTEEKERDREYAVRSVACPNCGAVPGKPCRYTETSDSTYVPVPAPPLKRKAFRGPVAHTGRYDVAVLAGLVPAMKGVRP